MGEKRDIGRLALLIDLERCTGCKSCEAACRQEHRRGPGEVEPLGEAKAGGWIWIEPGKRFCFDDVLQERYKDGACSPAVSGARHADREHAEPLPRRRKIDVARGVKVTMKAGIQMGFS